MIGVLLVLALFLVSGASASDITNQTSDLAVYESGDLENAAIDESTLSSNDNDGGSDVLSAAENSENDSLSASKEDGRVGVINFDAGANDTHYTEISPNVKGVNYNEIVMGDNDFRIKTPWSNRSVKVNIIRDDSSSPEFESNMRTDEGGFVTFYYKIPSSGMYEINLFGEYDMSLFLKVTGKTPAKTKATTAKVNSVKLKKNGKIKIGKYVIKLSKKQYKSLVKAFKKGKSKSITIKTKYKYKVKKSYVKTIKKHKTLKLVKTFRSYYYEKFDEMWLNGWEKVSEHCFTKKNPKSKEGLGLSAYRYSISKWVKKYKKTVHKTEKYPVKAKIILKSNKQAKIKVYSHGKTFKDMYLTIV